jgi:glycosylphosphatidylinositol transamidase
LGRTIESSLRSFNNLLERLHASYFFYLLPLPGKFIPVGHYLPSAILMGASVTLGGFDIPDPVSGFIYLVPPVLIAALGWVLQSPLVSFLGLLVPRPQGDAKRSMKSMAHLGFGAIIPTLAMVNFPQAILLALVTFTLLAPYRLVRIFGMALHPYLLEKLGVDLQHEWEVIGNLTWVGVFALWVPLSVVSMMI